MAILKIRDADGNVQEILAIRGKDGKNGVDGKDGYTPVKGGDYFDGVNGKDGAAGKDGVDGKDGDAYVLTDADKAEIAAMVSLTAKQVGALPVGGVFTDFNAVTEPGLYEADADATIVNGPSGYSKFKR